MTTNPKNEESIESSYEPTEEEKQLLITTELLDDLIYLYEESAKKTIVDYPELEKYYYSEKVINRTLEQKRDNIRKFLNKRTYEEISSIIQLFNENQLHRLIPFIGPINPPKQN